MARRLELGQFVCLTTKVSPYGVQSHFVVIFTQTEFQGLWVLISFMFHSPMFFTLSPAVNPRNSLFWKTTFIQSLRDLPLKVADHQACAYGSQRPKWTRLQFSHDAFLVICRVCPGECATHKHLPWGLSTKPGRKGFATSEETAYPYGLAAEIAQCFRQAAYEKGIQPPPVSMHQASCDDFLLSMARASSGPHK